MLIFFFGVSRYENTLRRGCLCCYVFAEIPNLRAKYYTIISSPTVITSDRSSLFSLAAKKEIQRNFGPSWKDKYREQLRLQKLLSHIFDDQLQSCKKKTCFYCGWFILQTTTISNNHYDRSNLKKPMTN